MAEHKGVNPVVRPPVLFLQADNKGGAAMGMRMQNVRMTTTVSKEKLLDALRVNLARHSQIVQEARDGYVTQAREALERRLEELRTGKVVSLKFTLNPPLDYSEVYRTAIQMLEWNADEMIVLQADEFKQLVLDEWDWIDGFIASNSAYSTTARRLSDGGSGG
jgi:hypothetical protein